MYKKLQVFILICLSCLCEGGGGGRVKLNVEGDLCKHVTF